MTKTRAGLIYITGLLTGVAVINIINIMGYCHHGIPGGELIMIILMPLLIYVGCVIGQEIKQPQTHHRGYRKGYQAASDRLAPPVNYDSTGQ